LGSRSRWVPTDIIPGVVTEQAQVGRSEDNPLLHVVDRRGEAFTLRRAYRYRIYPTKEQEEQLVETKELCRRLYNTALEERKRFYEKHQKNLALKTQRDGPESTKAKAKEADEAYRLLPDGLLDQVLASVHETYSDFFRRARRGEKPGQPRFKSASRYKTITVPRSREFSLKWDGRSRHGRITLFRGKRQNIVALGPLKVRVHRPIPESANLKRLMIKQHSSGRWYAIVYWEIEDYVSPKHPAAEKEVALHPGVVAYLSSDAGEVVEPHDSFRRFHKKYARRQRRLARRSKASGKDSKRRQQAARLQAKEGERILNRRRDFQHKLSRRIADQYGVVVINRYDLMPLLEDYRNKPLHGRLLDAAFYRLFLMLRYKVESTGGVYVEVDAWGTVRSCSRCGADVPRPSNPKTASKPEHRCPSCGLVLPRGVNAARNAKKRAAPALRGGAVGPAT